MTEAWKFNVGDRIKPRAEFYKAVASSMGRVYGLDITDGKPSRYKILFDRETRFRWLSRAVVEEFYEKEGHQR